MAVKYWTSPSRNSAKTILNCLRGFKCPKPADFPAVFLVFVMEHSRHLSRAIIYTLGGQLTINEPNSCFQILLQWKQIILLYLWYCQIKGVRNFCDAFKMKHISLTCCCAVITLSSGRCMKRKAINIRFIPTNVVRPIPNQQDPASTMQKTVWTIHFS